MSLRFTEKEAIARGWIKPNTKPAPPKGGSKELNTGEGTPQFILYHVLKSYAPDIPLHWERSNLIPGRRFVTDLFIPPKLVIEVDGFGYHRSKFSFQKDRIRQNIFAEHGFIVLRYYTGQIHNDEKRVAVLEQIVRVYRVICENKEGA
jgi:hypothetical protein